MSFRQFDRARLQELLTPGSPLVTLEGRIGNQAFAVEWTPHHVNTGKPPR